MGQNVYILAKPEADLKKLNLALKRLDLKNSFTTAKDIDNWLNDINTDPKSPQGHLKPADRDLTREELCKMFENYTTIGLLSFDVYFSRTSDIEAAKYLKFICANALSIEHLKNFKSFIERYPVNLKEKLIIESLNLETPDPVKLPKSEQEIPDLQGGLLLCKSWSLKPFWVIFGKTENDQPRFLKSKIYEDDMYNNIYHDKAGYAYLLIPLMPLGNNQLEFVEEVYHNCWQMGLRECFTYFIPFIYGLDISNINKVATDFKEFYTGEELRERFWAMFRATESIFHYNGPQGFVWRDLQGMFVPTGFGGNETSQIKARCSVLTALLRAIGPEASADLMSNLTGQVHKPFEFDMDNFIKEKAKLRLKY